VLCAGAAVAQEQNPALVQQQVSETQAAALLIQLGRLDEAKLVLVHVLQVTPNDNEAIFLTGLIAVAEKRYDDAVEAFRRILATEPERERVRLELARAFFLEADYDNAERNFRFARAGDLPPETKTVIDQYLAAIVRLRKWSYSVALGVADDTNINGASNVRTINLYGLPFTLSDNARATSGLGAAMDLAGEWSPLIFGNTKARFGGLLHRLEYSGHTFDDMTVSAYAGPEFLFSTAEYDALITSFRRWYGGEPYNEGVGLRGIASYVLAPAVQLSASLDAQTVTYRQQTFLNGPVYSGNLQATYTISPASSVRLTLGVASQRAKSPGFANNVYWVALDYYRDMPFGFSANVEPAYSWTNYDAAIAAFGATRHDRTVALRLDLLNRRIEYAGFAPRLSYIYITQQSSIALYRFSRNQIQFGVTRQF
jgi:tetratricopeptide (TPR) repeat protein